MSKHLIASMAAGMLLAIPAFAQDNAPGQVAQVPTTAQCDAGYREDMPWTRQEFIAECAKVKAKDQGQ